MRYLPRRVYPQTVHIGGKFGDNFRPICDKFVDKAVVVTGVPHRTFRLARRGRLNRQTGSRSDPRDGPGNQVRRSQGRRARNPAATRDCGLVRSLRTRRTAVPTSSFGRFRVRGNLRDGCKRSAAAARIRGPRPTHDHGMWRLLLLRILPRRLLPLLVPVRDRPAGPPASASRRRPAGCSIRRPDHRGPRDGSPAASHRSGRLTRPLPESPTRRRPPAAGSARLGACPRPTPRCRSRRPAQDWRILVAVFWVTSMVEGLGVSQIFALLPTYLREMGVRRGRPARLRRAVQRADLRRRHAARAAVGRVGRQVQPQGRHRPERARRGGRVRRRRARARAVAARPGDAADRLPARATPGSCWPASATSPRAPRLGHDDRDLRRLGPDRVRGRSGPRRRPDRRVRLGAAAGLLPCRPLLSVGTALLVTFGSKEVRPEVVPDGPDRRPRLRLAPRRPDRLRVPAHLRDLRHLVPGHPDEPAVHPGAGRGHHRGRARASPRRSGW